MLSNDPNLKKAYRVISDDKFGTILIELDVYEKNLHYPYRKDLYFKTLKDSEPDNWYRMYDYFDTIERAYHVFYTNEIDKFEKRINDVNISINVIKKIENKIKELNLNIKRPKLDNVLNELLGE